MFRGHQRHVLGRSRVVNSRHGSAPEQEQALIRDCFPFRRRTGTAFSGPVGSVQENGSLEDRRGKVEEPIGSAPMRINRVSHLVAPGKR